MEARGVHFSLCGSARAHWNSANLRVHTSVCAHACGVCVSVFVFAFGRTSWYFGIVVLG